MEILNANYNQTHMRKTITNYFSFTWRYFGILFFLMAFSMLAHAQTSYTFKGKVTTAEGETLPGATVQIEGTNFGTVTDIEGDYTFQANIEEGSYVLIIRSLGLLTEEIPVTLGAQTEIVNDANLTSDILNLDEIIVTGVSAATSRKQLGNAISSLDATAMENTGAVAVDQAIAGKVAGALVQQNSGDPAGGISIRLRGASTVVGSSDPLYIIDGVFLNNNSNELVDIGGNTQNRLVDINPDDIDRIEILKGASAAAIYGSRASNGVVQIFTKRGKSGKPKINFSTSFQISELRKEIPYNEAPVNGAGESVIRYNYQDDVLFSTAYGTDNDLSISGGDDNTSYFIAGSYLNNEGIVTNSGFERLGLRINIDQQVNDWLSINGGLNYSNSTSDDIPNGGISAFYGAITGFLFLDNSLDISPNESGIYPAGPTSFGRPNPQEVIDRYQFGQETNRIIGNIGLTAAPVEGLSITYKLGLDFYNQSATGYIPPNNTSAFGDGWATRNDANVLQHNQDLNVNYETDLTTNIKSTTSIGGSWQGETFERLGLTGAGLAPSVQVPDGAATLISDVDFRSEISYWGAFVQQTFGIGEKLFITGALRLDGASTFGEDERNQVFGKASASYILSEESFWQESLGEVINTFKLRASWGQAGNVTALGAFDRFTRYSPISYDGSGGLVPTPSLDPVAGNEDLAPERMDEVEFGFDATFLDNRIGVEFTYYSQQVEDLLLNRELALSTGFNSRFENVGSLENKGIELLIRARPIQTDDFSWDVQATYASNDNEVTDVAGEILVLNGSFGTNAVIEGESLGVFYHSAYARDANGGLLLDDAGLPFAKDEFEVLGDPNPDWFGSLINDFTYKNLSLRVQFDAVQGFDVFNWNRRLLDNAFFGGGEGAEAEILGTRTAGLGGRQAGIREEFVEDGSFIKLRELSLSYTIRPKIEAIQSVRFSLVGRNILSIDDYSGWDPEVNTPGQSNGVRGFDFAAVPIPRTYQLGINISF